MEYQSFGRPQRPKGANIKQALKVMLVLAVCAWLVYQIKHSIWNKTENYRDQTKLVVGHDTIRLGRKGTPSRLDERAVPDSRNEDSSAGEAYESNNGRDDVFDGAKKGKTEEEFGHVNEKFSTDEGKEVVLEPEKQPNVSSKNKYKDSSKDKTGKSRSESGDKEHGHEKYPKRPVINDTQRDDKETEIQLREPQNDVQVRKNAKSDLSRKENDEDEDPRIREKETRTQENVVESVRNDGVTEGIDEVQSFHDENGVPPDCNETEIVVGQGHMMHEENISDFSKGSRLGKSNIYEVTSGEDNNIEVTLEGTKNDAIADEENNAGTTIHLDASGINRNSEIAEGDNLVL